MGQNWDTLSVPVNGDQPDVEKVKSLISFSNLVPFSLVRNGNMEFWNNGASSPPDNWTLSGAGAAVAQESSTVKLDTYSAKVTYGAAAAILYQQASSFAFYQGKEVKAWCWIYSSSPNIARITIDDGVGQASSDFHPGDGIWRKLTVSKFISSVATKVELQLNVDGAGFAFFDVATIVDFDSITGSLPNLADAAAAASVAVLTSGPMASRPANPGQLQFYWTTDADQHLLFLYTQQPAIGDNGWILVSGGG